MGKSLIVYCSLYGTTMKYIEWIKESTDSDVVDAKEVTADQLMQYDTLVFGGYVRKLKIMIAEVIKENWNIIKDKKIILFLASAAKPDSVIPFWFYNQEFHSEIKKNILFYPVGGCINRTEMTEDDKDYIDNVDTLLRQHFNMTDLMITKEYESIIESLKQDFDDVKEKYITPVIKRINTWNEEDAIDEIFL